MNEKNNGLSETREKPVSIFYKENNTLLALPKIKDIFIKRTDLILVPEHHQEKINLKYLYIFFASQFDQTSTLLHCKIWNSLRKMRSTKP